MKFKFKTILLFFAIITLFLTAYLSAFGQSRTNQLYRPCPGSILQAKVEVLANGDVNISPCPSGKFLINGVETSVTGLANLNGLIGGSQTFGISGANTAGWDSASTTHTLNLPVDGLVWDTEDLRSGKFPISPFNDVNKLNLESPLGYFLSGHNAVSFIHDNWPSSFWVGVTEENVTLFQLGNSYGEQGSGFLYQYDPNEENSRLWADVNYLYFNGMDGNGLELRIGGEARLDGTSVRLGNGSNNALVDTTDSFSLNNADGRFFSASFSDLSIRFGPEGNWAGLSDIYFRNIRTFGIQGQYVTDAGDVTINEPVGVVTFTTGTNQVTVSNSNVAPGAVILLTQQNTDTTCNNFWIETVDSGSFRIRANANCTGEARVAFFHISVLTDMHG